jgi:hypothetical protein
VYVLQRAAFDQLRSRYEDFDQRVVEITEQRAAANRKAKEERELKAKQEAERLAAQNPPTPPESNA